MLKTKSLTSLSITLQLLINKADEDAVGRSESGGNKTNLSNPSTSKRSTKIDYLTSKDNKRGSGNIKKGIEAARGFDYLTPNSKKAFNHLQHTFIKAPILQYFDPNQYI